VSLDGSGIGIFESGYQPGPGVALARVGERVRAAATELSWPVDRIKPSRVGMVADPIPQEIPEPRIVVAPDCHVFG
jgi:hypothetical protein